MGRGAYWAFVCQLDDWGLWKWGVKQTILHRCPQGFSVPNRFNKNKSLLPSESSRSLWFTSPLDDTSLNVIGQLKAMKCSGLWWNWGRGLHTAPICDRQGNINVNENPYIWPTLLDSLLSIQLLLVTLCGTINYVFDCKCVHLALNGVFPVWMFERIWTHITMRLTGCSFQNLKYLLVLFPYHLFSAVSSFFSVVHKKTHVHWIRILSFFSRSSTYFI